MVRQEWRCIRCQKLLGILEGDRLHIRFSGGHDYTVGLPATAVCRGCKKGNELGVQQEKRVGRTH